MAIQFHCPYCTASIRVPDTAAGKQGTCPKCETKLIVPKVGPAAEVPPATSNKPPAPKPKPSADPPQKAATDTGLASPAPPEDAIDIPSIQTESPTLGAEPSMARVVRKRARRKGPNPLVPIALFSVVLGAIVFWMWQPAGKLGGQLPAERLDDYQIPPGRVDLAVFELPAEDVSTTLEAMQASPPSGVLVRDWFDMEFRPDNQGLEVVIKKTTVTEVFRVQTSKSPALRQLIRNHKEELLERQHEEYQKAGKRFIEDWQAARENDQPLDMTAYRSSLGFNRLTGIAGFGLVAQIGARTYRAVHEDSNGDLYFLLPASTEKFVLRGRQFEDGVTLIPGSLTVDVKTPSPQKTTEESPEPEAPPPTTEPPAEGPDTKTESNETT